MLLNNLLGGAVGMSTQAPQIINKEQLIVTDKDSNKTIYFIIGLVALLSILLIGGTILAFK